MTTTRIIDFMTIQSYIELFHLLFLRQLDGQLDKNLYALKGGCNLRFFLKSIRYSEDIDFDVTIISKDTLEKKINKILNGVSFRKILSSKGIEILQCSSAKQTETTQRWKVQLQLKSITLPISTKIEFSRRRFDEGVLYSPIDAELVMHYELYQTLCNHYGRDTAVKQKINALIHRTETQARDIFDLKWLYDHGAKLIEKSFSSSEIDIAIENTNSVGFDDFKGQVLAYLMEDYKVYYNSPEKWDEMKGAVVAMLREVQRAAH